MNELEFAYLCACQELVIRQNELLPDLAKASSANVESSPQRHNKRSRRATSAEKAGWVLSPSNPGCPPQVGERVSSGADLHLPRGAGRGRPFVTSCPVSFLLSRSAYSAARPEGGYVESSNRSRSA